jgi:hypothetical protein
LLCKYTLENTEETNKNGQFRNTGNIGYTQHKRMDNPETLATLGKHNTEELTIQNHWQQIYMLHTFTCSAIISMMTLTVEIVSISLTQSTVTARVWVTRTPFRWDINFNKTSNIGYTQHKRMDNPETLATLGKHNTEELTIQNHWQHWVHTAQRNGQYRNTGKIG